MELSAAITCFVLEAHVAEMREFRVCSELSKHRETEEADRNIPSSHPQAAEVIHTANVDVCVPL